MVSARVNRHRQMVVHRLRTRITARKLTGVVYKQNQDYEETTSWQLI